MTYKSILALPLLCLALTSCSDNYFTPTSVTERKIEVVESAHEQSIAIENLTKANLEAIANEYKRYGGDSLNLTVSYNPSAGSSFTASDAMRKGSEVVKILRDHHYVDGVKASILPIKSGKPTLFVDYARYQAVKPDGCGTAPGMDNKGTNTEDKIEDYEIGCSLKTTIAKQVYRPKDLAGVSGRKDDYDGRRITNSILGTGYYEGSPNAPLEGGESASDE